MASNSSPIRVTDSRARLARDREIELLERESVTKWDPLCLAAVATPPRAPPEGGGEGRAPPEGGGEGRVPPEGGGESLRPWRVLSPGRRPWRVLSPVRPGPSTTADGAAMTRRRKGPPRRGPGGGAGDGARSIWGKIPQFPGRTAGHGQAGRRRLRRSFCN